MPAHHRENPPCCKAARFGAASRPVLPARSRRERRADEGIQAMVASFSPRFSNLRLPAGFIWGMEHFLDAAEFRARAASDPDDSGALWRFGRSA